MALRRRTTAEKDLAKIAEKVEAARADLEARRLAEKEAEAEQAQKLDDLAAALGFATIDEDEYEQQKAAIDARLATVTSERVRAEAVMAALCERAYALETAIETAKTAAAEENLSRRESALAETEQLLARQQEEREQAEEALTTQRRWQLDAGARFSGAVADAAKHRAQSERATVLWHVGERHHPSHPDIPPWLRDDVAAEIARRMEEDDEYKRRLKERAVSHDADLDGLREREAFPVSKPVG